MNKKCKLNAVALAAVACVAAPLVGVLSVYADGEMGSADTLPKFDPATSCVETEDCDFKDGTLTISKDADLAFEIYGSDIKNIVNNGTLYLVGGSTEGSDALVQAANGDAIVNNGILTVAGSITVDALEHGKAAIYNNGTAELEGGVFERSKEAGVDKKNSGGNSYYTILNHGDMTIRTGVTVKNNGHFSSLFDNGYYDYNGVEHTGERNQYIKGTGKEAPTLTIEGGTFDGGLNTIKNDDNATVIINGGEFKNFTQAVFQNNNVATVNGGTFDGTGAEMVLNNRKYNDTINKGELTIAGGTFTAKAEDGVMIYDNGSEDGVIEISGGKFVNALPAIKYIVSSMHLDTVGNVVKNEIVTSVPVISSEVEKPMIAIADLDALKTQLSKTEAIADILKDNANATVVLGAPAVDSEDLADYYAKAAANGDETLEERVNAMIKGLKLLGMFDATLEVNDEPISELDSAITLTLALPEATATELKNVPEGKIRKYYVIRIHEVVEDGKTTYEVEPLPAELKDGALVFTNDKFSMLIAGYEDVDDVSTIPEITTKEKEEETEEPDVADTGAFTAEGKSASVAAIGVAVLVGIITSVATFTKLYKKQGEEQE